ncbi:MAG: response regulator transcription factor [Chloroflexi bacterium]|nr:response regulator transcription factor [Chloroflexota bacterium]
MKESRGRSERLGAPTRRELEVLNLIAQGMTSRAIAARLSLSVHTVNGHRSNLLRKLGAKNSAEMVRFALRNGLVEPLTPPRQNVEQASQGCI